ncbi:MAG: cyclic nucleotide-binding domain-containing protein [Vicinamibacteria bacterium]
MPSVQEFIAKKNYPKALELIRDELAGRPKDPRLRLQQADVLILAGRAKDAVSVLLGLADEHASDGFAAKAIAVLKRIEKIAPGRRDVEERLAHLIQEKVRTSPSATRPAAAMEIGLEEFDPTADTGFEVAATSAPVELAMDAEPEAISVEPEPIVEVPVSAPARVTIQDDDLEGLDYVASNEDLMELAPEPQPVLSTPLFEGFSQAELVAVMRGMNLKTFAPGDVLMAEGAPGESLYVLTTGSVKCWVKDRKGHYMKVQELPEGAFFGEISVLTGKPRTATLTAASYCEALELDKKTLDSITATHPHVREVLKKFHEQRAQDTVEAILKKRD